MAKPTPKTIVRPSGDKGTRRNGTVKPPTFKPPPMPPIKPVKSGK